MDIKSELMLLNGCEAEIKKLEAPMENFTGLSESQVQKLKAYHTRKGDLLDALSKAGYDTVCVRGKWWATPRGKVEGVDVLLNR